VVAAILLILIINQSISWFNKRRAARAQASAPRGLAPGEPSISDTAAEA
jgi:hypothetical protein